MPHPALLSIITFETNMCQSWLYHIKLISVSESVTYLGKVGRSISGLKRCMYVSGIYALSLMSLFHLLDESLYTLHHKPFSLRFPSAAQFVAKLALNDNAMTPDFVYSSHSWTMVCSKYRMYVCVCACVDILQYNNKLYSHIVITFVLFNKRKLHLYIVDLLLFWLFLLSSFLAKWLHVHINLHLSIYI